MEFITASAAETQKLAADLIKKLAAKTTRGALVLVLGLVGELGAGKTTFIQGLAKALGVKERVLSPTFVLMKHFNILAFKHFNNFYHIDCYRVNNPQEMETLGFREILKNPENLVVVEWAEKIRKILPADTVWIEFEHLGEDKRKIKIQSSKIKMTVQN